MGVVIPFSHAESAAQSRDLSRQSIITASEWQQVSFVYWSIQQTRTAEDRIPDIFSSLTLEIVPSLTGEIRVQITKRVGEGGDARYRPLLVAVCDQSGNWTFNYRDKWRKTGTDFERLIACAHSKIGEIENLTLVPLPVLEKPAFRLAKL